MNILALVDAGIAGEGFQDFGYKSEYETSAIQSVIKLFTALDSSLLWGGPPINQYGQVVQAPIPIIAPGESVSFSA